MEQIDTASLPQNLEAEQALLGAVLANNKAYEKVSEFLRPYHFADSIHAKISVSYTHQTLPTIA